jgi:integrase
MMVMARDYYNLRDKALFVMCYLTGGRLSEIIPCKYLHKRTYIKEKVVDKNGMPVLRLKRNPNESPIIQKSDKILIDYPGILKKNVTFNTIKDKKFMVIQMHNRKNKNYLTKNTPIPVHKEGHFISIIEEYLETLGADDPLFPFSGTKAREIIGERHLNPHFLRDIRLTHLVTMYDFGTFHLMKFAGWQSPKPAERYIRLGIGDMADKF